MKNTLIAALVCLPAMAVIASIGTPPPLPQCWKEKWTGCNCTGSCAHSYILCPTKVICDRAPTGSSTWGVGVPNHTYGCGEWYGGTGSCNTNTCCQNGTFIRPSTVTVSIDYQPCEGSNCP